MALTLKLDLADVLEKGFSVEQRKTLTPLISRESVKREFAKGVLNKMLERTNRGIDKRGIPFKAYSKAYKESRSFKIFGKRANRVNLKLTGGMQASIVGRPAEKTKVALVIPIGTAERKARGHINGSGPLPVRDFWGVPMDDQVKVLKDVLKDSGARSDLLDAFSTFALLGAGAAIAAEALTTETEAASVPSDLSGVELDALAEVEGL